MDTKSDVDEGFTTPFVSDRGAKDSVVGESRPITDKIAEEK